MKFAQGALLAFCVLSEVGLADQIVMKDGDRITGTVVKKEGDTVTFDSRNFGRVKIKWDDISELTADQPLNVSLQTGQSAKETIKAANGQVQVGGQNVASAQVTALRNDAEQRAYERRLHPGILDLWTITGSLNIAGTKGNAETSTLTTPFNFVRASNSSNTTAYFNSIRSTATVNGVNAQTARAIRGGWSYSHNVTSRVFLSIFNDYEYDKFQNLDLRVVLGAGAGYQIWKREKSSFSAVAGVDWDRDAFAASGALASFTRRSAEFFWGDDFSSKLSSRTTITQSFRMFDNLSQTGEYRMNFDAVASTQLRKWLNWDIGLSDRYLSDPVPGRKPNDFLYTTGFGFSFAR